MIIKTKTMKKFLKQTDLQLINGGYLTNKKGKPVFNANFNYLQQRAEYIVTFAEVARGKDFVGKKADSVSSVKEETFNLLQTNKVKYIQVCETPKGTLTNKLAKEAMDFMEFKADSTKAEKINEFLQEFNTLNEFEEFGLFFEEGITKLNKIYTLREITEAVTEVIDIL